MTGQLAGLIRQRQRATDDIEQYDILAKHNFKHFEGEVAVNWEPTRAITLTTAKHASAAAMGRAVHDLPPQVSKLLWGDWSMCILGKKSVLCASTIVE